MNAAHSLVLVAIGAVVGVVVAMLLLPQACQPQTCCGDGICEDHVNCPADCTAPELGSKGPQLDEVNQTCPECPECPECECEPNEMLVIPWSPGSSGGEYEEGNGVVCDVDIDLRDIGPDFVASGMIKIGELGELKLEGEGVSEGEHGELTLIINDGVMYLYLPTESPDWYYYELPEELLDMISCSYSAISDTEFELPGGVEPRSLEEAMEEPAP